MISPNRYALAQSCLSCGLWLVCASLSSSVSAQESGDNRAEELSQARYQSTYNTQQHPAFGAAGSGPNSLGPRADRMFTFSLTGHWGQRLALTRLLPLLPSPHPRPSLATCCPSCWAGCPSGWSSRP